MQSQFFELTRFTWWRVSETQQVIHELGISIKNRDARVNKKKRFNRYQEKLNRVAGQCWLRILENIQIKEIVEKVY